MSAIALALLLPKGAGLRAQAQNAAAAADAAFAAFWAARTPYQAAPLAEAILKSGISFDEAIRRLKQGRPYAPQVTGVVRMSNRTEDGIEHFFALNVPADYDFTRKYQVRFQLHGGVANRPDNKPRGPAEIGALAGDEQIYVIPYAWADEPWWSVDQELNLRAIIDTTKRMYNVDENRVFASGVSDGGTGAYYLAMRDTTLFAAFLPLNAFIMVLANDMVGVEEPLFPNNLRNKPIFVVNGGDDPLYATSLVEPYIAHMKKGGVNVVFEPQPDGHHDTTWWPVVKPKFERFTREHPRDPLPDTLTWQTSDVGSGNRAHWLIIDHLGAQPNDAENLPDLNVFTPAPSLDFGVRANGTRITRVLPGSNADAIGLKSRDTVVRINGQTVSIAADLVDVLGELPIGTPLEIVVARNQLPVELSGTLSPTEMAGTPEPMFTHHPPSGRVDLTRTGNTVTALTRGVAEFTLLLSPDRFDFSQPVKVVANGRTVFERRLERDLVTLLKWASRDNDRTMLFGAEVHINLAGASAGVR